MMSAAALMTLTATFTVLVVIALRRSVLPSWLAITGYVAAGLIATGVVIPVIEPASVTNFAGYVVWCAWLLAVAVVLFPRPPVHSTCRPSQSDDGRVRTQEERDEQTLDIMSVVFGIAFLLFAAIFVGVVVKAIF
jgi:hypothetical protein